MRFSRREGPRVVKWNRKNLLTACEDLLKRSDCTLQVKTINSGPTAQCAYDLDGDGVRNIVLTVDPSISSLVEGFLHEALHVVLVNDLDSRFSPSIVEKLVKALESELWLRTIRKGDTIRWRKIINEKIG